MVNLKVRPCQQAKEKIVVARNPEAKERTLAACFSEDETRAIKWKARGSSISRVVRSISERYLRKLVAEFVTWLLKDLSEQERQAVQWYAASRNEPITRVASSAMASAARRDHLLQLFSERKCV